MVADLKKRFWISLVLTIPILLLSTMIQEILGISDIIGFRGDIYILFSLATLVFVYGGYPFIRGFLDEMKSKKFGMMTLITVAITTAYSYSSAVAFGLEGKIFFWELATLIDIMLLGHWIEMKSVMGASSAIEDLAKLLPSHAHKLMKDNNTEDTPLQELTTGDLVLVKPGEKVPVDGIVVEGETTVDESMLTGESKPVLKERGNAVIGGSINGEGSIIVKVMKTGKDSFLSQVVELVEEALKSKSKTQDLANRAAVWLTVIALACGAITFFVWTAIMSKNIAFAVERTVTVMVITCPHALGLAVPLVVSVSTVLSAKNGFLIRNRVAFENARKIQAIIFDKTGTLTKGSFEVTDVITFGSVSKEEILKYAATIEYHSQHPIAKGIVSSVGEFYKIEKFKSISGKGAEGVIDRKHVMIASPGYIREKDIEIDNEAYKKIASQGKTIVFVLIDGKVEGAIALADTIRPESKRAISSLKKMNIKCVMLTGDNKQVAKWVAEEIDIDEYFAEVLPNEKSEKVKEIQSRGLTVAVVGDGVNDAPALAQADIGIAIGAGTDVAIEVADIILIKNNPEDVAKVITLSHNTYRKMVQNLTWATGYNVFAIPLAAGVLYSAGILLTPAMGAVLMSLSTVIVSINARLLR
jgi:Cu2+-exporting ATPase